MKRIRLRNRKFKFAYRPRDPKVLLMHAAQKNFPIGDPRYVAPDELARRVAKAERTRLLHKIRYERRRGVLAHDRPIAAKQWFSDVLQGLHDSYSGEPNASRKYWRLRLDQIAAAMARSAGRDGEGEKVS